MKLYIHRQYAGVLNEGPLTAAQILDLVRNKQLFWSDTCSGTPVGEEYPIELTTPLWKSPLLNPTHVPMDVNAWLTPHESIVWRKTREHPDLWPEHYIGHQSLVSKLKTIIDYHKNVIRPLPSILFEGPAGCGKNVLAMLIAYDMASFGWHIDEPCNCLQSVWDSSTMSSVYPKASDLKFEGITVIQHIDHLALDLGVQHYIRFKSVIATTENIDSLDKEVRSSFDIVYHMAPTAGEDIGRMLQVQWRQAQDRTHPEIFLEDEAAVLVGNYSGGSLETGARLLQWVLRYATYKQRNPVDSPLAREALDLIQS